MFRNLKQLILTTLFAIFASQASAMFIQPDWLDPTESGVGTNRYAYSGNDPVNRLDPNGNNFIDKFFEDFADIFRNDDQRQAVNIERYNRTIMAQEELQNMYDEGNINQSYYDYYSDVLENRLDRYSENLGRTRGDAAGEAFLGLSDIASLGSKKAATDAAEDALGMVSRTKTATGSTARKTDNSIASVNQMNQSIRRGQAPKTIERVDKGKVMGEIDHVHLSGGHALNRDGSWKHGGRDLSRKERDWLTSQGWNVPK